MGLVLPATRTKTEMEKEERNAIYLAENASGPLPLLPGGGCEHGPDRLVEDVLETLLCQRRALEVSARVTTTSMSSIL